MLQLWPELMVWIAQNVMTGWLKFCSKKGGLMLLSVLSVIRGIPRLIWILFHYVVPVMSVSLTLSW